jgi:hypothetical protein
MRITGLAVRCKTGIAVGAGRPDASAHYVTSMTATIDHGRIRYSARWLCTSWGSQDVIILPVGHGRRMCAHCQDRLCPTVYRCLSAARALVYIGSSITRTRRLRQHEKHADWWPLVTDVQYQEFPTYAEAFAAAPAAIRAERPMCNRKPGGHGTFALAAGAA